MSRSYRKNPIITQQGKVKRFSKRRASKSVRKVPHWQLEGGGPKAINKKYYCSYDITDYHSGFYGASTFKELCFQIELFYNREPYNREWFFRTFSVAEYARDFYWK